MYDPSGRQCSIALLVGTVWGEVHGRRGKGCANARRHRFLAHEAQLCSRADVACRRVPDGLSDVCVGRAGGPSQHFQHEFVATGRVRTAVTGLIDASKFRIADRAQNCWSRMTIARKRG